MAAISQIAKFQTLATHLRAADDHLQRAAGAAIKSISPDCEIHRSAIDVMLSCGKLIEAVDAEITELAQKAMQEEYLDTRGLEREPKAFQIRLDEMHWPAATPSPEEVLQLQRSATTQRGRQVAASLAALVERRVRLAA